jgi:uncharacterized protein YjbJ (UPF0337 family)
MSEPESAETTAGGAVGHVLGKLKSAVGSLVGNDELQREGNLQQAQVESEAEAVHEREGAALRREELDVVERKAEAAAERERLQAEVDTEDRKERIEQDAAQREHEIAVGAAREQSAIEQYEAATHQTAESLEVDAVRRRAQNGVEIARLEQAARQAELKADTIDPEVK